MSCGCAMSSYDGNRGEFSKFRIVKARKEHECCVCYRTIEKGEKYEYVAGSWEGDFTTYKTCADCLSIRNEFFCGEYLFEFQNDLWEHLVCIDGQVKSECLEALTPAARARVIDMIDELWEKYDE